mmetsp:Transcript_31673/g.67298  ORF Transcript_31673/g.67298 Transcript_31673/m.67298 type:complete len:712 (-) Transcript_31673:20-2155(-)
MSGLVINHETSLFLRRWDMVMAGLLMFVCFVSPFEVAFVQVSDGLDFLSKGADVMFWINRLVDILFMVDIVLQFFTTINVQHRYGASLIRSKRLLAEKYLKGWFGVDLVSVIPFDIIGMVMKSDDVSKLKIVRAVRLLRLLKLARLLRGMRIFQRWEVQIGFSYRKLTLWKLIGTVVIASHWISCVLGMLSSLQGDTCWGPDLPAGCVETWLTEAATEIVNERGYTWSPLQAYTIALHATSSIIVHPHIFRPTDLGERITFLTLIFIGGFIWTRVISRTTAIMTSMDRHTISFHQNMDDLNAIAAEMNLPADLRRSLRAYFMETRRSAIGPTWQDLQNKMSPRLRTEVAYQQHRTWMRRIPYMKGLSKFLLAQVAAKLQSCQASQNETFGKNFMLYVVDLGLVGRFGKVVGKLCILHPGAVWGEEHLLLSALCLLTPNVATAITYALMLTLDRESFIQICQDYPECRPQMRKQYIKYTLTRGILYMAKQEQRQTKEQALATKGEKGAEYQDEEAMMKYQYAERELTRLAVRSTSFTISRSRSGHVPSPWQIPDSSPSAQAVDSAEMDPLKSAEKAMQRENSMTSESGIRPTACAWLPSPCPSPKSLLNSGSFASQTAETVPPPERRPVASDFEEKVLARLDGLEAQTKRLEASIAELGAIRDSTRRIESLLRGAPPHEGVITPSPPRSPLPAEPPPPPDERTLIHVPAEPP